jgi:putative phage-type endonuclease
MDSLEDITDTLVFDEPTSIFDDSNTANDFVITCLHLIDEFVFMDPDIINDKEVVDIIFDELQELIYEQFSDEINTFFCDTIMNDIDELLDESINIYFVSMYPEKYIKLPDTEKTIAEFMEAQNSDSQDSDFLDARIKYLKEFPQPTQRTEEWYAFRHNLITASNAHKAMDSQSAINQLIYEKCQPLKTGNEEEDLKMTNTKSPLHWGQKYEPVSVMVYEDKYDTKVDDFGCIKHSHYDFLGASPDGIIVNKDSERYGRMLEIKNVVSREITGIPKKEYFIQMQLQMEVCELNKCDFLETKFVEYPGQTAYLEDTIVNDCLDMTVAKDKKLKGIMIQFHAHEGKIFYAYKPLNVKTIEEINIWENEVLSKYQSEPYNYVYLSFIYWKLDVFSCILVLRNQEWFKNNIKQLENVWRIIEKERITGYEHRAPNKKPRKEKDAASLITVSKDLTHYGFGLSLNSPALSQPTPPQSGCLLKFNKINKLP